MILPLRQRHRRIFAVLGVVLPIAFVVGIAARKPAPTVEALPAGLEAAFQNFFATEWKRDDLFAKVPAQVQLLRETTTSRLAISFSAPNDFAKPDLLVYWAARNTSITDTLPENAQLLGAFSSAALPLPEAASITEGALVLFSLADNEIVDVSKLIWFGSSTK